MSATERRFLGTTWAQRRERLMKMRDDWWRQPTTSVAIGEAVDRNDTVCAILGISPSAPTDVLIEKLHSILDARAKR